MEELGHLAIRASIAYLYALLLLRLSGKRSIGNLSPLDFMAALIIGDLFDDLFWGDVPVSSALTAIAVVLALHTLNNWLASISPGYDRLVGGAGPTPLVQHGQLVMAHLARNRLRTEHVLALLREQGEDQVQGIRVAALEPSGHLSVLKTEPEKPVPASEKDRLRELLP